MLWSCTLGERGDPTTISMSGFAATSRNKRRKWLAEWDLYVAAAGEAAAWDGRDLMSERHENNVWARQEADGPWRFDLTIGDGSDERWIFRRDRSLSRPWDQAIVWTGSGIPYLAPEFQLLFKSKQPRPKDHIDAEHVIPALAGDPRRFLDRQLPPNHQWRSLLEQH